MVAAVGCEPTPPKKLVLAFQLPQSSIHDIFVFVFHIEAVYFYKVLSGH